jgi:hypothetical protein
MHKNMKTLTGNMTKTHFIIQILMKMENKKLLWLSFCMHLQLLGPSRVRHVRDRMVPDTTLCDKVCQ